MNRGLLVLVAAGACRTPSSPPPSNGDLDARPVDAMNPPSWPDASPSPMSDAAVVSASVLRFAIVGDTRPPNLDDTAHYPTDIITKIWQDVAAEVPQPAFAVSTGDYMFADTGHTQQDAQLDLYLGARQQFPGTVYAAMGNHECTGATASNCGPGTKDGVTSNFSAFLARMVTPLGFDRPWYVVHLQDPGGAWTAKLVLIAANAWTTEQATWLDATLAEPTTYTFVVRHEGANATTAPGVTPSAAILAKHPLTLLVVGHTHSYAHYASDHEVIVGNGGAPLTSGTNYGYGMVERRDDGAIKFTAYDYQSHAVLGTWAITASGAPTT